MNSPYIKQYNENGEVVNHINEAYITNFPNRRERNKKEPRFYGESKNHHLTIVKTAKFLRHKQIVKLKDGSTKTIHHYLLQ
jgi:hypothetical protein